ncbi:MAG: AmmeMemoRadiSam system protein A, partial [Eubacteriaceae bacterium]|nr:AmmeMemoRadiSam system protein A [Eubacteriaceae bacterium]
HYRIQGKLDHGCIVPLYYIDKYYQDYQIVHISIGMLPLKDHYRFGMYIQEAFEKCGLNGIIIASADLSHCLKDSGPYAFAKEGPIFDEILVDSIREKRYLDIVTMKPHIYEPAGQCGLRSIVMTLGAMDGHKTSTEVYSYEGPFGVGYMTAGITLDEQSVPSIWNGITGFFKEKEAAKRSKEDGYIKLAREAITHWITSGEELKWEDYKKGLDDEGFIAEVENTRKGVFVSVHNSNRLRGCIGTISPVTPNAAMEIIHNAIEACAFDSRFHQVEPEELEFIDVKVDVLNEAEKIDDIKQLDVKRYGVIVKRGQRKGLLLPDLEGVDSAEEQIRIAMQKAGIPEKEKVELFRFEVIRHEV